MSEGLHVPSRDMRGVVILISGARQVGKTTLLLRIREAAIQAGCRVGGFLSVARFEGGTKTGIDLVDAATGSAFPLATVGGEGAIRTGHYVFNPDALEAGLRYARAGQGADVFFVDELGPLELKQGEGWIAVIDMIRAREFGVALVTMRQDLLTLARECMILSPDSPLLMIDGSNRETVAAHLATWIVNE